MSVQRFSFDREFDKAPSPTGLFVERRAVPSIPVAEHQAKLAEAEEAAFRKGYAEGLAAARGEETARLAAATEALTRAMVEAGGKLQGIEDRSAAEMSVFAIAFARRLAGRLIEREPLAPIEDAARLAFLDLRGAPHIVARVAPDLVEEVKRRLTRIAAEMGIEGKIVVMGEPEIPGGDCRIEWADGGVVRSRADLDRRLGAAVEMALAQAQLMGRGP